MKRSTCVAACVAMLITLAAPIASGAIVAETGFNDAAGINGDPTPNSPYTLDSQLHNNGAVETGWAGGWTQTTTVSATRGSVATALLNEGDGAARFESGAGTSSAANVAAFGRNMATTYSDGLFTVDYYFRVEQMANGREIVIYAGSPAAQASLIAITHSTTDGSFSLRGYNGNGSGAITAVDSNIDLAANSWYKLTAALDLDANNWDLLLNDTEVLPNLGFRHNSAVLNWVQVSVDRGNFSTGGTGQIAYLDQLVVSQVPEPAAIAMGICGLIGLTVLRRRSRR